MLPDGFGIRYFKLVHVGLLVEINLRIQYSIPPIEAKYLDNFPNCAYFMYI